ncbi:MAG: alpha/beta hydrolase [Ardenticatenaceae bacterium]|nr:alpha/beta hydrolase [Ardenticatenaceae bacterium]
MEQTSFAATTDGLHIAYDVSGEGPFLMLLHGGGGSQSRRKWHEVGYVSRLHDQFTVITMDIRGHGESDKPTDPNSYTIDQMCDDVLAVADACEAKQFVLWGYSFGGNIGRFLATRSNRVTRFIVIGIPFGPAAGGSFRQFIDEFQLKWKPVVDLHAQDQLILTNLSEEDRGIWQRVDIPVMLAWLTAMLDWPENHPGELRCPTLWLSGSKNEGTIASMDSYSDSVNQTNVEIQIIEGLNHQQEFDEIDRVLPVLLEYSLGNS